MPGRLKFEQGEIVTFDRLRHPDFSVPYASGDRLFIFSVECIEVEDTVLTVYTVVAEADQELDPTLGECDSYELYAREMEKIPEV